MGMALRQAVRNTEGWPQSHSAIDFLWELSFFFFRTEVITELTSLGMGETQWVNTHKHLAQCLAQNKLSRNLITTNQRSSTWMCVCISEGAQE